MALWWTHSDYWQQAFQVIKCPILPRQQTCTHTDFQAVVHCKLISPLPLTHRKQCKWRVYWPWTFHLCNTLPHPRSSTLGCSSQLPQGKATPTTVLLLPYSKQGLALSCIPRHHAITPFISPTSPSFLCQLWLLWSAAHFLLVVLWHFSLAGSIPYSSSLLAVGVLM